jgi:hypothetical protein
MRRFVAVALVIAAVLWTRRLGAALPSEPRTTALALGFTLIVALVTGNLLRGSDYPGSRAICCSACSSGHTSPT